MKSDNYAQRDNGVLVHRLAHVADDARLGANCIIHAFAYVETFVEIGSDCVVNPYAFLGRLPDNSLALARQPRRVTGVLIGDRCVIGCNAVVYGGVQIANDTFVGDYASIREGTVIGARCVIGRQVTVNYNAIIGNNCRFQDGTHITGHCEIGDDCFFGVGAITSNDRRVDLEDYHYPEPQPCRFGKRVLVGSGANVLAGVTVGDNATIGAGAVVVHDVPRDAVMLGPRAQIKDVSLLTVMGR